MESHRNILLLRGLAREVRHWNGFDQMLQKHLSTDKVICIDLPGTGVFNKEESPTSIAKIQNFVRKEYLKYHDTKNLHIVAISLGGMVALDWASTFPLEIQSVCLINSSVANLSPMFHRCRPKAFKLLAQIIGTMKVYDRELLITNMVSNSSQEERQQIAKIFSEYVMDRPITFENATRQLLAASKFKPNFNAIKCKGLVLRSENDNMVNSKCSIAIHKKLHWLLKTHPIAGHDISLDDPEWLCVQIKNFLSV